MAAKAYTVGICGGSASGKTYVLQQLQQAFLPEQLMLISQDNYYKPIDEIAPEPDGSTNWDLPQALNLQLIREHIEALLAGKRFTVPEYGFNNPEHVPKDIDYYPAPLIAVEGHFIFHDPQLNDILDLKIFVEAEEHIKLIRRIRRDTNERNIDLDYVFWQYEHQVIPTYKRYVEPYKNEADIILPNNGQLETGLHVIVNHLQAQLATGG